MRRIDLNLFPEGREKAITFSYDDGTTSDLQLADILDRYGMKGAFHLNSGALNTPGYLVNADVCRLAKRHEVSCHSVTHPCLEQLPPPLAVREILDDRLTLEALTGQLVRGMSYPGGGYSEELVAHLRGAGMDYARTVEATNGFAQPSDFMKWHPTTLDNGDLDALLKRFHAERWRAPHVFFIWGHSIGFERDNGWARIEAFCKRASGDETVWYATGLEIFEYAVAQRSLRFSADGRRAYNPSGRPVWIAVDGEAVALAPDSLQDL